MTPTEKEGRQRRMVGRPPNLSAPDSVETETEIDLLELFYRLLENLKYILLTAVLCTFAAGVYTFVFQTPQYEATAKLYVMNPRDSAINLSDLQIGTYLKNDYQEVFKTWEVHEMVIKNLGLSYTYSQMQDMLTVTNPTDTRILYITVTSESARQATVIANEYATVAKKYISATMATEEPNILSVALQPILPVGPNRTRNIMLGFLLGALLAIGVITVRFVMDDKVKTADDIAKYANLATLAIVPVLNGQSASKAKKKADKAARKGA